MFSTNPGILKTTMKTCEKYEYHDYKITDSGWSKKIFKPVCFYIIHVTKTYSM